MHDFVVEMTMRLNGVPLPSSGRWTFGEKTVFGQSVPARLPPPLDAAATVYWPRTARLYMGYEEHRHAVVHRRIHLKSNGELGGFDRSRAALPSITVTEQDAFSRYAVSLSEPLIEATVNQRQLNTTAWYLDALDSHHACGVLGATNRHPSSSRWSTT
jgi:hypothetical protein